MTMMSFWGLLNMIVLIVIVGLVIYALLSLVAKGFEKKEDPALKLLRERYARGEINENEFEQKKQFLTKK
jgi:putative membrane protein